MSMVCQICPVGRQRFALSTPQPTAHGELVFMCLECAALHARPRKFPEGTQRTEVQPGPNAPERAERDRAEQAHQLELAQGKVAVLRDMLQAVLDRFPELRWGLTSAVRRQTLRDARAVLEECK